MPIKWQLKMQLENACCFVENVFFAQQLFFFCTTIVFFPAIDAFFCTIIVFFHSHQLYFLCNKNCFVCTIIAYFLHNNFRFFHKNCICLHNNCIFLLCSHSSKIHIVLDVEIRSGQKRWRWMKIVAVLLVPRYFFSVIWWRFVWGFRSRK